MDIKEQIAIMQHYANGGKIEYRAKPHGTKSYPRDWKEVISPAAGGNFQFDWEQEEARIKPEPRVVYTVNRSDGQSTGYFEGQKKASAVASFYNNSDSLNKYKPFYIKKFVEVIE